MSDLSPKTFRFALENGVGTITLDRPQRLNSLTFESYLELGAFFPALERHPEVRSLVITGEGTGEMQTTGYGAYASYHSPMLSIMSGMMLGSMLSSAFHPGYVPVYTSRPYVTHPTRVSQIRTARPSRPSASVFSRPSGSGRSFPARGGFRGGARFGVRRGDRPAPVRLTA